MKTLAYLKKTFLENLREWKILSMTLVFAPFFVLLMWGYYEAAAPAYRLLYIDHDRGATGIAQTVTRLSQGLIDAWREARHPDGRPVFELTEVDDVYAATSQVKQRDADLLVEIPASFSSGLITFGLGELDAAPSLTNHSDAANPRSSMAMAFSDYTAYTFAFAATGSAPPLGLEIKQLGSSQALNEFDLYVPALLVLALIMVMFTAAASLIKEVDKGTMNRLTLSRLTTTQLMAAVSINQILIGLVSLVLAYVAAIAVGYQSQGSLVALLLVGALSTLSVMAMSVLVAAFLGSIFELMTIGVFPFFILMFFSECMFPLPKVDLFRLAGNTVYLNDILPTSLTVRAFNQILNYDAGLGDILFELGMILVLTLAYFGLGAWLFWRRHQRI